MSPLRKVVYYTQICFTPLPPQGGGVPDNKQFAKSPFFALLMLPKRDDLLHQPRVAHSFSSGTNFAKAGKGFQPVCRQARPASWQVGVNLLFGVNSKLKNYKIHLYGFFLICSMLLFNSCNKDSNNIIETSLYSISCQEKSVNSWVYTTRPSGNSFEIMLPVFEINGQITPVILNCLSPACEPIILRNDVREYIYEGTFQSDTSLRFQVKFRIADNNPVVRFRYSLKSSGDHILTKNTGRDNITYFLHSMKELKEVKEIRLSVFNDMIHSCNLSEATCSDADFMNSSTLEGPMMLGGNSKLTFLCSYEHDFMYPDNYLEYRLFPDRKIVLSAIKGNYYHGESVDGYCTVWFEVAGIEGGEEDMAAYFRKFIKHYQSESLESRKPYIYYNTWGRQERVKWAGGTYLSTMNLDYTLSEIERVHDLGIEFYVLDAGWFDKTGDWGVNLKNFPDGFQQIREKLKEYDMRLGLWMDPAKASIASNALKKNQGCQRTRGGIKGKPSPVWETEESVNMCLVSPYWEHYADILIRLYNEYDVRYFYLDGVGQTGCDDPGHFHGTEANLAEERHQCYGFLLPVYLGKIMEKVIKACPDVIFDFDVTEAGRIGVGLQFLANGRYFILNNGPYYHNFDLCPRGQSILPNGCRNIFIQPGPARTWFMRSVLDYDKWIPSNLFMANYQADDPVSSQIINIGSLVLGQNAIWGDVLKISPEGVTLFSNMLNEYKKVRYDVAEASLIRKGKPGDTPEIYEKINPETGNGVVVIFSNVKGKFSYTTVNKINKNIWHNEGVAVKTSENGQAIINAEFNEAAAGIVFFGVNE